MAADTILEAEELGETAEEIAYNYGLKLQDVIDIHFYAHDRNPAGFEVLLSGDQTIKHE